MSSDFLLQRPGKPGGVTEYELEAIRLLREILKEVQLMRHEARWLTHDEKTCKVCRG